MRAGTNRSRSATLTLLATVVVATFALSQDAISSTRFYRAQRASLSVAAVAAPAVRHPLDPLTSDEIARSFQVIEAYAKFPAGAYFPTVMLKEPPKSEVLAWAPGKPFTRESFSNVFDRAKNELFEAVVDLRSGTVISWVARPGAQPAMFASDYVDADTAVRADPRWQKAMRERGLNPDDVYLDGWAPGDVEIPAAAPPRARLIRELSFFRGLLPNVYDRPIEGVVVTVDLNRLKVVDFVDTGIRPVNTTNTGSAATPRTGLKQLVVSQPNGPSFQVDGHSVTWQSWHFHIGYTPREGLVIQQVGYEDKGVVRPIIYRLSLDDIYVPYALPDRNWVWRTALDVGEYNIGQYAENLAAGTDVPTNAVFFDEATPSDTGTRGGVVLLPHAIAMYERDGGSLWDRSDPATLARDARLARELVVQATYPIGNYTYGTSVIFRMDGGINVQVGATGTTLNRGVRTTAEGEQYGTTVAFNIAAPAHQHFFNYRIDWDVDGVGNRVVERNTHAVASSFGNAFKTDQTVLRTEQMRDVSESSSRTWAIESATRKDALGKPTAYEVRPIDTTSPYSSAGFTPLQHAQFAEHAFWVSRYRPEEKYATGDYPNRGPAGEGLPNYIDGHESIEGQDLVTWYTMGMTHLPTVEEYPVMTTDFLSFALRPLGFFDKNPALDAP